MVDKIEMSLDDIIKSNRTQKPRRGGVSIGRGVRRGAPQRGRGARQVAAVGLPLRGGILKGRNRGAIQKTSFSRGDVNNSWKHDFYNGPQRIGGAPTKLMISNLDYGVTESDIRELFADFGPLKNASVHYDRSGRSLGTADVTFERKPDAVKAIKQYNGVPLDGRPMNIQLATSELPVLSNRGRGISNAPYQKQSFSSGTVGRGRGGFGTRRGSTRGNATTRRGRGPAPTADELDAELDAYVNDTK